MWGIAALQNAVGQSEQYFSKISERASQLLENLDNEYNDPESKDASLNEEDNVDSEHEDVKEMNDKSIGQSNENEDSAPSPHIQSNSSPMSKLPTYKEKDVSYVYSDKEGDEIDDLLDESLAALDVSPIKRISPKPKATKNIIKSIQKTTDTSNKSNHDDMKNLLGKLSEVKTMKVSNLGFQDFVINNLMFNI